MTNHAKNLVSYLRVYGLNDYQAARWLDENCEGWREHDAPDAIDLCESIETTE